MRLRLFPLVRGDVQRVLRPGQPRTKQRADHIDREYEYSDCDGQRDDPWKQPGHVHGQGHAGENCSEHAGDGADEHFRTAVEATGSQQARNRDCGGEETPGWCHGHKRCQQHDEQPGTNAEPKDHDIRIADLSRDGLGILFGSRGE